MAKYRGPTEHEIKESIVAWIEEYLARTGKKNVELAEEIGVSEATISNIRLGKLKPGFRVLVRLHFGVGAYLEDVVRHAATRTHKTKEPAGK